MAATDQAFLNFKNNKVTILAQNVSMLEISTPAL